MKNCFQLVHIKTCKLIKRKMQNERCLFRKKISGYAYVTVTKIYTIA